MHIYVGTIYRGPTATPSDDAEELLFKRWDKFLERPWWCLLQFMTPVIPSGWWWYKCLQQIAIFSESPHALQSFTLCDNTSSTFPSTHYPPLCSSLHIFLSSTSCPLPLSDAPFPSHSGTPESLVNWAIPNDLVAWQGTTKWEKNGNCGSIGEGNLWV